MKAYSELLSKCLNQGVIKEGRNGKTYSLFGVQLFMPNIWGAFPLLTAKEMKWDSIVAEFLWILSGKKDIKELKKVTSIYNAWEDGAGEVPTPYGYYLRHWPFPNTMYGFDQLKYMVDEIKYNSFSRRLVMSAWEPKDCKISDLPPCNFIYNFNVEPPRAISNKKNILNLSVFQRSADLGLGLPFDIAIWSLMLMYIAKITGTHPGSVVFSITDAHIYFEHVNLILSEWLRREPKALPTVRIDDSIVDITQSLSKEDIILTNYNHHPFIKLELKK